MMLVIRSEHLNEILKMARRSSVEICGILLGRKGNSDAFVEEIKFIKNRLNSEHAFEMEPIEMVQAMDEAEDKGLELIGIFHSHPCKPIPSERDRKGMKNWPVVWLIVGNNGDYKAFVFDNGRILKVEVEVLFNHYE